MSAQTTPTTERAPDPHRADPRVMRLALEVLRPAGQRTVCFHCARPLFGGVCERCDR
jgi:hypothetical protein